MRHRIYSSEDGWALRSYSIVAIAKAIRRESIRQPCSDITLIIAIATSTSSIAVMQLDIYLDSKADSEVAGSRQRRNRGKHLLSVVGHGTFK